MLGAMVTILLLCLLVFLIEQFLKPGEPWRLVFRVVLAVACVIVLLNAIAGPVIW